MTEPFLARVARIKETLAARSAGAFLTANPRNFHYLCGFTGSSGALLIRANDAALFTDGRYACQAREEVRGARVILHRHGVLPAVGEWLRRRGERRVLFEAAALSVAERAALGKACGPRVRLVPSTGVVEQLRAVKDAEEVAAIRASARLASDVFEELLPLIRPGIREHELAAELEYRLRRRGSSGTPFDTIVAFGERTALPHARPSSRALRKNELVMLDWGAILRHYCSDLTRTVFAGRAPARIRRTYVAVLEAQQAALRVARPGLAAQQVDAAARNSLRSAGLARYFLHGTGHGIGLEIHEAPRVGRGQKDSLRAGHVITIEPGVYLEGLGGIRIEDDVQITEQGAEVLTTAPRGLLEL
jgi:Xaa-Pro aminopeptidase